MQLNYFQPLNAPLGLTSAARLERHYRGVKGYELKFFQYALLNNGGIITEFGLVPWFYESIFDRIEKGPFIYIAHGKVTFK